MERGKCNREFKFEVLRPVGRGKEPLCRLPGTSALEKISSPNERVFREEPGDSLPQKKDPKGITEEGDILKALDLLKDTTMKSQ